MVCVGQQEKVPVATRGIDKWKPDRENTYLFFNLSTHVRVTDFTLIHHFYRNIGISRRVQS